MTKILHWLREEFRQMLPVWIFFFVAFGLMAITREAIIGQFSIKPKQPMEYLVGSLIMAKAVLLLDAFLNTRWLRNRPLIYVTLWNTVLYSLAAFVLHNLEHLISAMRHLHLGFFEASHHVFETMADMRTLVIMMWVVAFTFVFCVLRELIHAIGRELFWNMFLGLPHTPNRTEDIRRAG